MVVVLPASMCAMMPMLRTLARSIPSAVDTMNSVAFSGLVGDYQR